MRDMSMDKYDDLQIALNVARDNLKSLNDKIGREQFRDTRKRPHWDREHNNGQHKAFDDGDKRQFHNNSAAAGGKRARNNVFSRLEPRNNNPGGGGGGGHMVKPKLSSRVTKEIPRREDVVAAQSDEASRARNKRMFGSLLGTLNKFCQDESRMRGRVEKKAIIEKKLEEQEQRDREKNKIERRALFVDRKKKLMEVRLLEIKMERMQDLTAWEENHKKSREFIRTKTGPQIFFRPKVMNEKTSELLKESQAAYDEELARKRETMQKELVEIEDRMQRELEKALEEKPSKSGADGGDGKNTSVDGGDGDRNRSFEDEEREFNSEAEAEEGEDVDEDDEEDDSAPRPRLVSQVVKSQVQRSNSSSSSNNVQSDRRHVLQSAVNKKNMIISVVNNLRRND